MSPTTTRSRPDAVQTPRPRENIDPRISARRSEVSRQQGRRRLRLAVALAALALLVFGVWSLLHSSLFSATAVTVVGATHETTAQIEAAAGLSGHPPLLDVNTGAAVNGLERLPWVRSAALRACCWCRDRRPPGNRAARSGRPISSGSPWPPRCPSRSGPRSQG